RPAGLQHGFDLFVDQAVEPFIEVTCLKEAGHRTVHAIVDQESAKQSLLGFDVLWDNTQAGIVHVHAARALSISFNSWQCPAAQMAIRHASRLSMFGEMIRSMSQ